MTLEPARACKGRKRSDAPRQGRISNLKTARQFCLEGHLVCTRTFIYSGVHHFADKQKCASAGVGGQLVHQINSFTDLRLLH